MFYDDFAWRQIINQSSALTMDYYIELVKADQKHEAEIKVKIVT